MDFSSNKKKGNCGLAFAIAYYVAQGYTVSIPMNDTQDYDLIFDNGIRLFKVQVKSTGTKSRYGVYVCSLRSCGGTAGVCYKTVKETDIDFLFVLTESLLMYNIPKNAIINSSTINLGDKYEQYKVTF